MTQLEESVLRDSLRELHAYTREFFRVQMSWVMFIGIANVAALLAFFSRGIDLESNAKPPLCVAFSLLNLLTAAQFLVRRFDFQLLGKQMREKSSALGGGSDRSADPFFPLELIARTGRLFTLAALLLAAVWGVCCLHVWNHETMSIWVYIISAIVFLVVAISIGLILARQIFRLRQQLENQCSR